MSGRRSHPRFTVHLASEASLRVFRDVHVRNADLQEVVALTSEPAAVGQQLYLDTIGDAPLVGESVEVLESRPVSLDGGIRHQLRLRRAARRVPEGGHRQR